MIDALAMHVLLGMDERNATIVLGSVGSREARRHFVRACAVRYAAHLLRQRVDRPVIRDRLCTRYNLSERTAYRVIEEAVDQLCQEGTRPGTTVRHDTPRRGHAVPVAVP
jgi:hypothetical protein